MKELEVLLNKRWILKSRDKEMYYKIRDALGELRKFTTEKMGCQIIDEMEVWMFIRKDEADHQIRICPLTGKIQGSYPEDYTGGRNDE